VSLVINHNLMAAQAARNLRSSFSDLSRSVSRLSSGLRITSAADDAAGLAIRELMRADITALNQGIRNANDAISLIQTADGALSVIDEKLIRMKELAMQASTGTYTSDQRLIIDSEYQAMADEISRIANSTDFNGIHLLNGNLSGDVHNGAGLVSTGKLKVHFGTANDSAEDYYYIQIGNATASALGLGGRVTTTLVGPTESEYAAANGLLGPNLTGPLSGFTAAISGLPGYWTSDFDQNQQVDRYTDGSNAFIFATRDNGDLWVLEYDGGGNYVSDERVAEAVSVIRGADSISTQQNAQEALVTLQNAIVSKDTIRANLGAMQNRLENTITNLEIQSENLQAAESRISDVDVSLEMTQFVRNQILTQAAVAMLSQANSLPRMAMQLLGG